MGLRDWIGRKVVRSKAKDVEGWSAELREELERQRAQEGETMSVWLKGAGVAFASGLVNGLTAAIATNFEFSKAGLFSVASAAVVGGLTGLALYLKQSPIPTK